MALVLRTDASMTVFGTYVLVHTADWLVLSVIGWAAVRWLEVPVWIVVALIGAWIVKDLLVFPSQRHYYMSEPPERRMLGEKGEALSRLDPDGFARVHGEIWQVRLDDRDQPVDPGVAVRVREIHGLRLVVESIEREPGA